MTAQPDQPVIPQMIEAEQGLLGALFVTNDLCSDVRSVLDADDFYEPLHSRIYEHILSLIAEGQGASPLTVNARMMSDPVLSEIGGLDYLTNLVIHAVTPVFALGVAQAIKDVGTRRKLIYASQDCIDRLNGDGVSPDDVAGDLRHTIDTMFERRGKDDIRPIGDVAWEALGRMEAASRGESQAMGLGLKDLTQALSGGLWGGDLIYLCGRPSMGKTTLGSALAVNVAMEGGGALFVSLEMDRLSVAERILSDIAHYAGERLPYTAMRRNPSKHDLDIVLNAQQRLKELPLVIDDAGGQTVQQIGAKARGVRSRFRKEGHDLSLIVIDQLTHIRASDRYAGQRHQEYTEISAQLKALAKQLDIPIVCLHQLNRGVEQRQCKRPTLSDMRESGSLEQDADVVMFVYRDEYYAKQEEPDPSDHEALARHAARMQRAENVMEVIVAKHRQGPTGVVKLRCEMAYNALRDLPDAVV